MISAYLEREERAHEASLRGAWYTAALSRTKRLPPMKTLLNPPKTRILTPEEKAERQAEFEELKARLGSRLPQKPKNGV